MSHFLKKKKKRKGFNHHLEGESYNEDSFFTNFHIETPFVMLILNFLKKKSAQSPLKAPILVATPISEILTPHLNLTSRMPRITLEVNRLTTKMNG